jgi:peptidoglycan glycosyltransferase
VVAVSFFPSYDPSPLAAHDQAQVQKSWNLLQLDKQNPMQPRSFRESYPPGSTFKVVTSTAVEQRAPELLSKSYPQLRELELPQTTSKLANFGREQCGGTLPDLLRISCNTGFAQIGLDLGAERLVAQAEDFGFNARPPLDMPAVATSRFPPVPAFKHDLPALAHSAIGQRDVSVTPLQMALVAAGIANGGTIMKPHLMAEIRDSEGAVVRTAKPEAWRVATTAEAASAVRDLMVAVVASGTGTAAQLPGVAVAGKTGTAQTGRGTAHAWFIAFAPAEAPRVAVAVIVEDQPAVREATGGLVAAPIAKQMMKAALGV